MQILQQLCALRQTWHEASCVVFLCYCVLNDISGNNISHSVATSAAVCSRCCTIPNQQQSLPWPLLQSQQRSSRHTGSNRHGGRERVSCVRNVVQIDTHNHAGIIQEMGTHFDPNSVLSLCCTCTFSLRDRKKGVGKIANRYMRASLSQLCTVSRNARKVLILGTCHQNAPLTIQ